MIDESGLKPWVLTKSCQMKKLVNVLVTLKMPKQHHRSWSRKHYNKEVAMTYNVLWLCSIINRVLCSWL
ncbi:Non-structural polyprotein pORF1 [Bienertia sinuspersici]